MVRFKFLKNFLVCLFFYQVFIHNDCIAYSKDITGERVKRQIRNTLCSRPSLECDDNQCVPETVLCDGIKNCLDGADESAEACKIRHPNWCTLPKIQRSNTGLIINCGTATSIQLHPTATEDFVKELTIVTCNSDSEQYDRYKSLCLNGRWTIPLSKCFESCPTLPQLENMNAKKCHFNDQEMECNETNPVGTILEPRCEWNTFANRENAICTENRKWSVPKLNCVECGNIFNTLVEIHLQDNNGRSGYCFGTVISPYLVITDANCLKKKSQVEHTHQSGRYSLLQMGFDSKYDEREVLQTHYPGEKEENSNIVILEAKGYLLWSEIINIQCLDSNVNLLIDENTDLLMPNVYHIGNDSSNFFIHLMSAKRNVKLDQFRVRYRNTEPPLSKWKGLGAFVEKHGKYYLKGVTGTSSSETNHEHLIVTDLSKYLTWIRRTISETDLRRRKSLPVYEASWINQSDQQQKIIPKATERNDVPHYEDFQIDCTNGEAHQKFVDGCILPNKNIYNVDYKTISCQGNTFEGYCSHAKEGEPVPQHTSLEYNCTEGFASYSSETSSSTCLKGAWTPPITRCGRICEKLETNKVKPKCTYDGLEVDCQKNLIANTEVAPVSCLLTHRLNDVSKYSTIYCREDGKWSGKLPECPVCGQSLRITKTSPNQEEEVSLGELPWHAIVYDNKHNSSPICSATIVSPYTLISSARCFYKGIQNQERNPTYFVIGVSKITSHKHQNDSPSTQYYDIEDIIFNPHFRNSKLSYQGDIAILVTKKEISFNQYVSPVCLYRDTSVTIMDNIPLEIASLDIGATGKNGSNLKVIRTFYINDTECNEIDSLKNSTSLKRDKFCTDGARSATMNINDSGSGIVQRNSLDSYYYLISIVSPIITGVSKMFSLGTSVPYHIQWIATEIAGINYSKNYFQG